MRAWRVWAITAGLAAAGRGAEAQVGHAPGHSPFHDIAKGHSVTALYGHLGGNGGRFGIGPHSGDSYGLRYDLRAGSTLQLGLGFATSTLDRLIVDPYVALARRTTGPVQQKVTFVEANIQFNLTGGKTWNRLAPFISTSVGLTFPTSTPADTSRFELGHKIYLAPGVGTRIFLTSHLHIRAEARAAFWKLKYPTSFTLEPPEEPGTTDNPNAVIPDGRVSQWTATPWLQVGLGYSFSP